LEVLNTSIDKKIKFFQEIISLNVTPEKNVKYQIKTIATTFNIGPTFIELLDLTQIALVEFI